MGGKVLIPAFSLGCTQTVVYYLNQLVSEGHLPAIPVYVDSPLSRRLTAVYRDYTQILDDEIQRTLQTDSEFFGFQGLKYIASQQESISLNRRKGSFIVIATSGMCENGRILHHLKHSVEDSNSTILLIGFQAVHTWGRRITERQPMLKIFGRQYQLRAHAEIINGLSAHADALDFKWWFEQLAAERGIGQSYVVHGESRAAQAVCALLRDHCDEEPVIPHWGESFVV